jgi:Rhodopirellula transposase DDE domain
LKDAVEGETAGDPMSSKKWQRSSLRQVSRKLKETGHAISAPTVARLLKAQDYSLKANNKRLAGASHPDRNAQSEIKVIETIHPYKHRAGTAA